MFILHTAVAATYIGYFIRYSDVNIDSEVVVDVT